MKTHLSDLSWPEVRELLTKPHAILIPVGSTEQHGLHLPLSVDSACAAYLSEQAAQKVGSENDITVVVAPTLHYGRVVAFAGFPGSIGISLDTATQLIADIASSLVKQGFKNIIFVNGHAENIVPISAGLSQVSSDFPGAGLYAVDWLALGFETIPKIRKSKAGLHADELETSLSLVIQPENVRMEKAVKETPEFSLSGKWVNPDIYGPNRMLYHSRVKFPRMGTGNGVMGDPTVASRETGEKVAAAVIKDLAEIIVEIVRSEKLVHKT